MEVKDLDDLGLLFGQKVRIRTLLTKVKCSSRATCDQTTGCDNNGVSIAGMSAARVTSILPSVWLP